MKQAVIFLIVLLLLFRITSCENTEVDLKVAIYPYIPESHAAIERFESAFEKFAKDNDYSIDLDIDVIDTYTEIGVTEALKQYDIVEIDFVMMDVLSKNGVFPLDDINDIISIPTNKIGPSKKISDKTWAKKVVPHWVCGNFFVHWKNNSRLTNAKDFEQIIEALNPSEDRYLYADLWGGGTLGEIYADAVLDMRGHQAARTHLIHLSSLSKKKIRENIDQDAVNAIKKLTRELNPKHKRERSSLHNLTHVYPKAFSVDKNSALFGYSERMHYVERSIQERPWSNQKWPIASQELMVRQFPFSSNSLGTPTWVDGFIVPKGRLHLKRKAIQLFLTFALSEQGYQELMEPIQYYPYSYLLPAYEEILKYSFVQEKMPVLTKYASMIDSSFPILDQNIFQGLDKAGEELKIILEETN